MRLSIRFLLLLVVFLWDGVFSFAQQLSLITPKNQSYILPNHTQQFCWNDHPDALAYTLQISTDPGFQTIVLQSNNLQASCEEASLSLGNYFWRVVCTTGTSMLYSNTYSIQVYDPSLRSDLSLWLDPARGVSLDASNLVDKWADASSNAYQLIQNTSTKRPVLVSSTLNGKPAIRFSGGQSLSGGDILDIGTASRSMFVVGKMNGTNQTFFAKSLFAGAPNRYSLLKEANPYFLYSADMNGAANCTMSATKYALYSICSDRSRSKNFFYIDNFCTSSGNITPLYNMNSNFRFIIGAYNNAADNGEVLFLNGDINEIVFVESADTSMFKTIQSYLRYKYSPPVDLGRDTTITADICPITLTIPSSFTNITWSTGETSNSIATNKSGAYWVQAMDIFGYVSSDTVLVNFPEATPPLNNFLCADSVKIWDPNLPNFYSYSWSDGSTDTLLVTNQIGSFELTFTDSLGCSKTSDSYVFTLDNYPTTFSIGPDTTVCAGNVLYARTNAAETVSYLWENGSTGTQLPVFTTGNYSLIATNTNGCKAYDTVAIVVSGVAPLANFDVTNICLGDSLNFTDLSVPGSLTDVVAHWDWNFGDGFSDTLQNPSYVPLVAGTRTVTLNIVSSGNCGAFTTKTVTVHQPPLATFSAIGSCSAQSVQLNDATQAGSSPVTNWLWNFGQPSSGVANASTLASPAKMYNQAGNFTILLTVKDANNCYHDTSLVHTVYWSPTASFSIPDACVDAELEITNTSQVNSPSTIQSTLWSFGDNTYATNVLPVKSFPNYGVHTIQLDVLTGEGCTDQEIKQIYVHPNPMAYFTVGPACMGTYTDLMDQSVIAEGSIDSILWVLNQEDSLSGNTARVVFDDLQQQQIDVHVFSAFGCETVATQFVEPEVELNAAFSMDVPFVAATEPISFTNESIGAATILWDLGDGTTTTDANPTHEYSAAYVDSLVTIVLYTESATGCLDTVEHTLSIRDIVLDAKMKQLFLEEENGYYVVGVSFENTGTVTLNEATFSLSWAPGPLFQEDWTGILQPGTSTIYIFNGKPSAFQYPYLEANYFCLDGVTRDDTGLEETLLADNRLCNLLSGSAPLIFPIYPNPATENIHIGILLTEQASTRIDILDARGRVISEVLQPADLSAGTHNYDLSVSNYREGMYYLRLTVNGEVYVKQFVKR